MIRSVLAVAVLFLFTGCVSSSSRPIEMMVSGPPGVGFTGNYEFGSFTGAVKTVTSGSGFDVFLEIPPGDGHCDVVKDRPTDALSVVASEGKSQKLNGFVPAGRTAIRFTREGGMWRHELLP